MSCEPVVATTAAPPEVSLRRLKRKGLAAYRRSDAHGPGG